MRFNGNTKKITKLPIKQSSIMNLIVECEHVFRMPIAKQFFQITVQKRRINYSSPRLFGHHQINIILDNIFLFLIPINI